MGGVKMKKKRYLLYVLVVLLCLCSMAATAEFTLTTSGIVPASSAGNISLPAPPAGANGFSVMAAASDDPDAYSLKNILALEPAVYSLTTESCGGSVKQLTSGKLNHVHPRVSENYVVYEEWNAGTAAIGIHDIPSGKQGIMYPASHQQTNPDASGGLIVYEQDGVYSNTITNVFGYDSQSQRAMQFSPSTTNQNQPAISGRYLVWQDWSSGNADIALADLNSGKAVLICKDLGDQKKPAISGGFVVWEDWRNGNADVYLYDIAEGAEYQLTTNKYDQKNPRISGKIVVWEDNRNGGSDVYALNLDNLKEKRLTSGTDKCVNPDVSGALVVWEDYRNSNADIMLLDLITGRIYQITSDDQSDQKNPSIFGLNIVWEDYRSGNSNIFLYTIPNSGSIGGKYNFYGSASCCGSTAPAGSVISAVISGSSAARASITTTQNGVFGSRTGPYLEIPVYAEDAGKTITFYINDQPADQTVLIGSGATQALDLSSSCSIPVNKYQFQGQVMLDSQYAPSGTVVSATIDGKTRSQVSVSSAGRYSGLIVPVYSSDSGKYLTFTATYNQVTYTTSQQIWIGSTGNGSGSGGIVLMSVESVGSVSAESMVSQNLDLTFTSSSYQKKYLLNGEVKIGNQYAPGGTVITALINNQARSQVSVSPAGQYSGLSIPVYPSDIDKTITFSALYDGITYTTSQQILIGSHGIGIGSGTGSGGVSLMSVESAGVSAEGTISQRLDLTFSSTGSQGKYQFYGAATIDGSPLQPGRIIHALIDNQVRGQMPVTIAGQYASPQGPYLEVPVSPGDVGKTIRFQTDSGAEADQTQLIVSGLLVSKNLKFSSKPSEQADFVAAPLQGTAPLSVRFTDKSSGSPKSYYWDFGDGSTSTDRNPVHTYNRDGVYSVGLVSGYWNGESRTVVKQNYISVGAVNPPNAQIGLNPGWNFISTPKMLADGMNNAKTLFDKIDGGGHSIFSYNPKSKSWTTVGPNTVINPLDAFWVYSTKKDAVYLYFAIDALQIPPTKKLTKGWNTFGVTSLNTVSAYNALLSIKDRWVYVIGYDSGTQRFQSTIMNVADSSQGSLYPGFGYWIYMSEEGDLAAVGL
jgi:beta propeller repeat protein